ncbi:MAG: site-2 protease family protein, partial [Candidatus Omnitrophica bacterium]|nr:site-2 protease family protein [Candidatus Omnitrophota bacterium]
QKIIYKKRGDDTVRIKVLRDRETLLFNVRIKEKEIPQILGDKKRVGLIGITPSGQIIKKKYSLGKAIIFGTAKVVELTFLTCRAILNIFLRKASLKDSVTGPLGMFYITQETTKLGLSALLHFIGILNISLTVFNLLPIPILDGGHLLLLGIEKIKRKALSLHLEKFLTQIGLSIIIFLALFIFYNDMVKFGIWEKLIRLIKR